MQHAGQADFLLMLLERVPAGGTQPWVEKGDNIVQYPYVHRERRTEVVDVYYIKIIKFLNKILLELFGWIYTQRQELRKSITEIG
jgi:hypothetical protein